MEEAGCTILYGAENIKVHSKVCLITRRDKGKIQYITQVGTGNYNEKTAKQYTDLCLMTARPEIGEDAAALFRNMATANMEGNYKQLLVSPYQLRDKCMEHIDREIAKGRDGYIFLKLNSITDRKLIDKLAQASQAGVEVVMNVRGICCLLPGIAGLTDRITVFSIVGRYLEHTRIYRFGRGEDAALYISSADFMTRNTERRVEVACPVLSPEVRKKIFHIIDVLTSDNVKARQLGPDGEWHPRKVGSAPCCSQEVFQEGGHPGGAVHPRAPRQAQEGQGVPLEAAVRPEKLTAKGKMGGPIGGRPFLSLPGFGVLELHPVQLPPGFVVKDRGHTAVDGGNPVESMVEAPICHKLPSGDPPLLQLRDKLEGPLLHGLPLQSNSLGSVLRRAVRPTIQNVLPQGAVGGVSPERSVPVGDLQGQLGGGRPLGRVRRHHTGSPEKPKHPPAPEPVPVRLPPGAKDRGYLIHPSPASAG